MVTMIFFPFTESSANSFWSHEVAQYQEQPDTWRLSSTHSYILVSEWGLEVFVFIPSISSQSRGVSPVSSSQIAIPVI